LKTGNYVSIVASAAKKEESESAGPSLLRGKGMKCGLLDNKSAAT
jgi:hypothetical protein